MIKKNQAMLKCILLILFIMIMLKLSLVFLWPFVAALILAAVIDPFVKLFCRLKISRKLSVIISFVLISSITIIILYYVGNYVYYQLLYFLKKFPDIISAISDKLGFLNIQKFNYQQIIKTLQNIISAYREKIINTAITTVNGVVYFIMVIITAIFISIDKYKIVQKIKKFLPKELYELGNIVVNRSMSIINIQFKLVLATTIQTILGLYVLGISDSLTIGIICGILDVLPVIGTTMVFIPMILFEFTAGNLFKLIGLICLYILLEINRKIMEIKFVGNNLHIHPVYTIISLYLGLKLYGLWGVILGPFIIILIMEIFNYYYTGKERGILL